MDINSEKRIVACGQIVLEYQLTRKLVRNINLRVRPDGKILVSASDSVPSEYIDDFVRRKQGYIQKALEKFSLSQSCVSEVPRQYIGGESYMIMGKNLRLKLVECEEEKVTTDGVYIYLSVSNRKDLNRKKSLMQEWLKRQQYEVFEKVCKEMYPIFQKYGVKYPLLKIRYMSTQWGSCQPQKGVITLNTKLFEAPRNCIEYVVLHEFTHFLHPNHSKEFYEFVSMLMPDWKERKRELEKWL